MKRSSIISVSILLVLARPGATQPASTARLLPVAGIARIVSDRIDAQHQGVGIVVGVIDASGRRIVAHGAFDTTP